MVERVPGDPTGCVALGPPAIGERTAIGRQTQDVEHGRPFRGDRPVLAEVRFREPDTELASIGVVGFEDVKTPAGSFRRCLVLHLTGTVAGAVEPGAGQRVVLEGGTVETREWYCQGVGLVKDRMKMSAQMRLPDGNLAETRESFERVLEDYTVAGSPARPER